jgi:hypothetical protein
VDGRVRASGGFDSQRYAAKVAKPASLRAGLNSLASHQKVQDGLDQSDGSPAHVVTARHEREDSNNFEKQNIIFIYVSTYQETVRCCTTGRGSQLCIHRR